MKTNVLMKIAVVLMAAFGAYAFSGSQNTLFEDFKLHDGIECTNTIQAMCDTSGNLSCIILINEELESIYNLSCTQATHVNSTPVAWRNK